MKMILDWKKYIDCATDIAAEGIVMLENDGCLPLKKGTNVALFGRMQDHYYKSGTGSGGMVNVKHVVTIREAIRNSDGLTIDEDLAKVYDEFDVTSPIDNGVGWGCEPWSQEEMELTDDIVSSAASKTDTAIVVLARLAGEDRDNSDEKGAYDLTDKEEDMLSKVTKAFSKTIVLINSGGLLDMSFVEKYSPSAVLYVWQAGMSGANAIPQVLLGDKTPSGHLTETIAYSIEDYPSDSNFGKGDGQRDNYQEDVYVGYRFFETFAKDKVMYPFGFGLTYTEFSIKDMRFDYSGDVTVSFTVENAGSYEGKCVPMIFASCPQGRLGKPSRVLCGFSKTSVLLPGESEDMTIVIKPEYFASYDDSGKTDSPYSWVLEEGKYEFFIGENVRDVKSCGSFEIDELKVVEKLWTALKPIDKFDRVIPKATENGYEVSYEPVPTREVEAIDSRFDHLMAEIPQTGRKDISFKDVKTGKVPLEEFVASMDDEELALIVRGEGMGSPKVTTGTAGAFAGVSEEMMERDVPSCCCSDGPSGMRIDSGRCAMALPNGSCIASTFNTALVEELFDHFGIEMLSNEIDVVLGPGINIRRHPLNGRNFEYFSEDPFLTGKLACAQLTALHRYKVTGCIKHFCTNNREKNRQTMSSNVSERALREIYLKGFEMAVKEADAKCIMTVYNRVNGVYGASNYELTTEILRRQFGFKGIVMSDWWANVNSAPYEEGHKRVQSEMVRAQNDLYMCCPLAERKELNFTDVYQSLKEGKLKRAELQRSALNTLNFALNTPAMDRIMGQGVTVEHIDSPFADDDVPVRTDVYFEVFDGSVNDLTPFKTEDGHDAVFGLSVKQIGTYDFKIYASSDLPELAQVPMTFFYTSIPIQVLTWNGTDGKEDMRSISVFCSGQPAIIRLRFATPGVKLLRIETTFVCKDRLEKRWDFS